MTLKILVVDDEPDVPLLIKQRFRKHISEKHLEFRFAANGVEALQVIEAEPDIDIVLSDINMPEMDGLTLLGKITDRGPLPKAVMVSAYGDMDNIRAAMNRGAFDFVTKPIDFNDLQATIDKTRHELELIRQALKARDELVGVRRELEIAANIQRSLLPRGVPAGGAGGRFDIWADVIPATEVGGDFYDYFMITDTRLGFVVADVSGKGVGAAMYMAVSRTLLRAAALRNLEPGECLERLNHLLCLDSDAGMFVTVCYGILDVETGALEYAIGGHPQPFIAGPTGARELGKSGDMVVGMMEDLTYKTLKEQMAPGEFLMLYSDGVNEAANEQKELFSIERVGEFLGTVEKTTCEAISRAVIGEVKRFEGTAPQSDDITVLTLGYRGQQ
jgi:phosphoserine phosphatase RsbU/P